MIKTYKNFTLIKTSHVDVTDSIHARKKLSVLRSTTWIRRNKCYVHRQQKHNNTVIVIRLLNNYKENYEGQRKTARRSSTVTMRKTLL